MTKEDNRIEWRARYDSWKESGISAAKWCRNHGLKDHQLYYWIQKFEHDESSVVNEKAHSKMEWMTVNVDESITSSTSNEPLFIHFGSISVEVRSGVNLDLVSDIVDIIQKQC